MDWTNQNGGCDAAKNIYVISPCSFAYLGLASLLEQKNIHVSRVVDDVEPYPDKDCELPGVENCYRIDVLLPEEIKSTLSVIKKLTTILNSFPTAVPVIIYCRLPGSWLFRMLNALIKDKGKIARIRLANTSLSCRALMNSDLPLLETVGRLEENFSGCSYKGLTARELDAVLSFYKGHPVKYQSDITGLSGKTIYNHRQAGLRKLQFIPGMLQGGIRKLKPSLTPDTGFLHGAFEDLYSYAAALEAKKIVPVFQVVTTQDKRIAGFEILLKWQHKGYIHQSQDFALLLKDRKICLDMMKLALDSAISGINKYNGNFDFYVTIPATLAADEALIRMAKEAIVLLNDPQWAKRLIFEFSETLEALKDKKIPQVLHRLRETGSRLFLDNCFSEGSAIFPVRQIQFDGFKLGRELVAKSFSSETDSHLLKTILYYCEMTGSVCTAAGINSEKEFITLADAGIRQFQGSYLSEPMDEAGIDTIVGKFY